jgi:multidrug resistance efflux pump
MRFGKLLLGSCVVLVSVWIIVGEQISGVSSDAVVNARLATVRAPMGGKLDMPLRAFGEEFAKGEKIAVLTNIHPDDVRLDDLRYEEALAAADLAFLTAIHNLTKGASLDGSAGVEVASNDSGSGLAGVASAAADLDGADLRRAEERLAAVQARIGREQARLGEDARVELTVPVDGVLWEVLAGDSEYVERGQDIAKFMTCGSALVTLSVPDHVYAQLRVGQAAKFRLDGTSTVYDGTITRMAGAGAETIYRNLVVAPSLRHLERYDIALLVPELRSDPELRCSVGQTGRVFFDSRPLDWLRTALR